jgi:hypothetical protein
MRNKINFHLKSHANGNCENGKKEKKKIIDRRVKKIRDQKWKNLL